MKNTLRTALLIIGVLMTLTGIVFLIFPAGEWIENTRVFAGENAQNQALALLIFGVLVFLAGITYNKR